MKLIANNVCGTICLLFLHGNHTLIFSEIHISDKIAVSTPNINASNMNSAVQS